MYYFSLDAKLSYAMRPGYASLSYPFKRREDTDVSQHVQNPRNFVMPMLPRYRVADDAG